MKYDKLPIDLPQQLEILKQRGLNIPNEDLAMEQLGSISYFKLDNYWKTMEVVSLGTLSKLYCNFADVEVKKQVAKSLAISQYTYLESWLKSATVLRNCCAHHARLWNRRFAWKPQLPQRLPFAWIDVKNVRPIKLYAQLCYLAYLEQSINPNSSFRKEIVSLLSTKPQQILKAMGFPTDWKSEPLWQC